MKFLCYSTKSNYQAMGNGTMCQTLNGKLQKLLAKQPLVTM